MKTYNKFLFIAYLLSHYFLCFAEDYQIINDPTRPPEITKVDLNDNFGLLAIFISDSKKIAIINNEIKQPGDELSKNTKLIKILKDHIVVLQNEKEIIVPLIREHVYEEK